MRPSRVAVSWGSLFLLTRPASNSANQARNLASSAGGSRKIASSISSTVMAAGIARRPQSLKNHWLANGMQTIFRRPGPAFTAEKQQAWIVLYGASRFKASGGGHGHDSSIP